MRFRDFRKQWGSHRVWIERCWHRQAHYGAKGSDWNAGFNIGEEWPAPWEGMYPKSAIEFCVIVYRLPWRVQISGAYWYRLIPFRLRPYWRFDRALFLKLLGFAS